MDNFEIRIGGSGFDSINAYYIGSVALDNLAYIMLNRKWLESHVLELSYKNEPTTFHTVVLKIFEKDSKGLCDTYSEDVQIFKGKTMEECGAMVAEVIKRYAII